MSDDLNYEKLYNTAQQELVNAQHTIRVLVSKIEELQGNVQQAEQVEEKVDKKKAN